MFKKTLTVSSAAALALFGLFLVPGGDDGDVSGSYQGGYYGPLGTYATGATGYDTTTVILSSPWGDFVTHPEWDASYTIVTPTDSSEFWCATPKESDRTAADIKPGFAMRGLSVPVTQFLKLTTGFRPLLGWDLSFIPEGYYIASAELCFKHDFSNSSPCDFTDDGEGYHAVADTFSLHRALRTTGNGPGASVGYYRNACWNRPDADVAVGWHPDEADTSLDFLDRIWDYGVKSLLAYNDSTIPVPVNNYDGLGNVTIDVTREVQIMSYRGQLTTWNGFWLFAARDGSPIAVNITCGESTSPSQVASTHSPFLKLKIVNRPTTGPWNGYPVAFGFRTDDCDTFNRSVSVLMDSAGYKYTVTIYGFLDGATIEDSTLSRDRNLTVAELGAIYDLGNDIFGHTVYHGILGGIHGALDVNLMAGIGYIDSNTETATGPDSVRAYVSAESLSVVTGIPVAAILSGFVPPAYYTSPMAERALRDEGYPGGFVGVGEVKPPWQQNDPITYLSLGDTVAIYRIKTYAGSSIWGSDASPVTSKAQMRENFYDMIGAAMDAGDRYGGVYISSMFHDVQGGGTYPGEGATIQQLRWLVEVQREHNGAAEVTPAEALALYLENHVPVVAPSWAVYDKARGVDAGDKLYYTIDPNKAHSW